ncbi:hypothetical protein Q5752_003700 [Cryptotrichosporon argae]
MPKRKSTSPGSPGISLTSFDAALDLLACETFARVAKLADNFEVATSVRLSDTVCRSRWDEAVGRYWLMKSLDGLCCGSGGGGIAKEGGDEAMKDEKDAYERPIADNHHPGAVAKWQLDADESQQWRRWTPRAGDLVLVDLPEHGVWPGKIIDRRVSFSGRTIPRGNHFYAVRVYNEEIQPTVTVKARLVPLDLRPDPPLLCSAALQSAYNHTLSPSAFDAAAGVRETQAAQSRAHPGAEGGDDAWRDEREVWKRFVNWLMNERRVEKARTLGEEREKRIRAVVDNGNGHDSGSGSKSGTANGAEGDGEEGTEMEDRAGRQADGARKKRCPEEQWSLGITKLPSTTVERGGIFHLAALGSARPRTPVPTLPANGSGTPSIAAYIRPALSTLSGRPASPRRADRRIRAGTESSPRRGSGVAAGTFTPPRPGVDECMPPSPTAPRLLTFDFVSPLGPVRFGRLRRDARDAASGASAGAGADGDEVMDGTKDRRPLARRASLEAVKEEPEDDAGWTLVRRAKRAGSAPCERDGPPAHAVAAGVDADAMEM